MSEKNDLIDLKDYIYGKKGLDLSYKNYHNPKYIPQKKVLKKMDDDIDQILNSSNDDHKAVSNYFKKLINCDPDKKERLNFNYFRCFAIEFFHKIEEKFKSAIMNMSYGTDIHFMRDMLKAFDVNGQKNSYAMRDSYSNIENGSYVFKNSLRDVINSMPDNFDIFYLQALFIIRPMSLNQDDIDLLIAKADKSTRENNKFKEYISSIKSYCQERPSNCYYDNFDVNNMLNGKEPVVNKISGNSVNILFSKPLEKKDSLTYFNYYVLTFGLDQTNTSDEVLKNITTNLKYNPSESIYRSDVGKDAIDKFNKAMDQLGKERILKNKNIPAQLINDCEYRKTVDECKNCGARKVIQNLRNKELKSGHSRDLKETKIICKMIKTLDNRDKLDNEAAISMCESALQRFKEPEDLDVQENKDIINELYEVYELKKKFDDNSSLLDFSLEQVKQKKLELQKRSDELKQKVNEFNQRKQALLEKVNDLEETSNKNLLLGLRDEVKKVRLEIESISISKMEDLADKENRFNLLKEVFDLYQQADLINAFDLKDKIRNANSFSNEVLEGWKNEFNVFKNTLAEKNSLEKEIYDFKASQEMEDAAKIDFSTHLEISNRLSLLSTKVFEFEGTIEELQNLRNELVKIKNDVAEVNKLGHAKEQLKEKIDDFKKTEEVQEYAKYLKTEKNIYDELDNLKKEIDKTKQLSELNDIEPKFNKIKETVSNAKDLIEAAKKKTEKPPEGENSKKEPIEEKPPEDQKPENTEPKEKPKPEEISHDAEKPSEKSTTEEKQITEDKPLEDQEPKNTEPKENPKPEEFSHAVEKPSEKPTTEDKPLEDREPKNTEPKEEPKPEENPEEEKPFENQKTKDKLSEDQNDKSLSENIFKSFGFWASSLVTVSGIPIGITTTFIFGIATSGVGGAALLIVMITKIFLFKKQMSRIKDNKKPIKKIQAKKETEEKKKIDKDGVRSN